MIFAVLTLVSALSISCIAAYFSIIGLSTIFPGSITSVIIMGSVLEVGKIIAAVWLHRNWKSAPKLIRSYLLGAIFVLMGITSMGIFGFLSKSHIEHQHTAEKAQAIVAQIDDKIKRERTYIERQKELITKTEGRIDSSEDKSAVNIKREQEKITSLYESLDRSIAFDKEELDRLQTRLDELNKEVADLENSSGGLFSSKKKKLEELRERQKPERESIAKQMLVINQRIQAARESTESQVAVLREKIEQYQASEYSTEDTVAEDVEKYNVLIATALDKIDKLETEKFSHQDGARELEAEVGPIKYVAELVADFTGITLDLGAAVRIVIIILIFVFDPLAILLVLAAHISLTRRFPKFRVDTKKIFEKQAELQEEKKLLDAEEKDLIERKKDIEEQETLVDLKEKQIEKYQTQVSKYKEEARTSRIESEKAKIEAENTSPITEEIEALEKEKRRAEKEVAQTKEKNKTILDQALGVKKDLREMKEVLGSQQKTRESISSLREEFNGNKIDMSQLKVGINKLENQNFDLLKENQKLRNANVPLTERLSNGKYRVSISSPLGGTHQFTREREYSDVDILNMQTISAYIDDTCPERLSPILTQVFETNVRKFLDQRMDNIEYNKHRPIYTFKP
jgi:uncharacterized membrane protein (DUF106 family)